MAIHHADVNLVALPEEMDFATAAGLGCRFATAFRAIVEQGGVKAGQWVAVFGCGGVGLSAVMIARAVGARPIAVDVSADALALAQQVGAEDALDARIHGDLAQDDPRAHRRRRRRDLDALGSAARHAHRAARPAQERPPRAGGAARPAPMPTRRLPLHLLIARELEIVGSHGMAAHAYPRMLRMVADGQLDPARLITRRITLDEAPEALATMVSAPRAGVTIIEPLARRAR